MLCRRSIKLKKGETYRGIHKWICWRVIIHTTRKKRKILAIPPSGCIRVWPCVSARCPFCLLCICLHRRIGGSVGSCAFLLCVFYLLLQAHPELFTCGCQVCPFLFQTVHLVWKHTVEPRIEGKNKQGSWEVCHFTPHACIKRITTWTQKHFV